MDPIVKEFIEKHKSKWIVHKWKDYGPEGNQRLYELLHVKGLSIKEILGLGYELEAVEVIHGNVLLNEGIQLLEDIILGLDTTSPKWDSSNAHLGVGDGTTAEDASQTGLQGSNKQYKGMDAGYPTRSNQTMTWRSTFGDTEANFSWNEFTVANGSDDSATNLNRKVESKGTKSGGNWTLTLQITIS